MFSPYFAESDTLWVNRWIIQLSIFGRDVGYRGLRRFFVILKDTSVRTAKSKVANIRNTSRNDFKRQLRCKDYFIVWVNRRFAPMSIGRRAYLLHASQPHVFIRWEILVTVHHESSKSMLQWYIDSLVSVRFRRKLELNVDKLDSALNSVRCKGSDRMSLTKAGMGITYMVTRHTESECHRVELKRPWA